MDTHAMELPIAHVGDRKENARAWFVKSVISPMALRRTLIMYDSEYAWDLEMLFKPLTAHLRSLHPLSLGILKPAQMLN